MFTYRKKFLLINLVGYPCMQPIHYYEDGDFVKMKHSMTKEMLTVNISPKLIMTEICNIYKLYCKKSWTFLLRLTKISQICISNWPPCLLKYVKIFGLALYIRNGVEDLKYSWSAHKSKHNRGSGWGIMINE